MSDPAHELRSIREDLLSIVRRIDALGEMEGYPEGSPSTPGQRLVMARNRARLSQAELGKKSGVNTNTIVNFENGRTRPRYRTLMAIADQLDIHWSELTEDQHGRGA